MSRFLIYALHADSSNCIYVGRSSNGLTRPRSHWKHQEKEQRPVHFWCRKLATKGEKYSIAVLEEHRSAETLDDAERFFISYFRSLGIRLLNCTDGGDGARNPIALTRRKMSLAKKNKPLPETWKQNIAASLRGREFTPEWKQKISEAKKGKCSPAALAVLIARNKAMAGRKASNKTRKRLSDTHRGNPLISGENNAHAKLTRDAVVEIRKLMAEGRTLQYVADRFGVTVPTIFSIKKGLTWRSVV